MGLGSIGKAFKPISKVAGGAAGSGIGGAILGPVGSLVGGKMGADMGIDGMVGGLKDAFLGKKDPGQAGGQVPLNSFQAKALGKYGELLDTDTDRIVKNSIEQQANQVRTNAADAERNAKQLVAQRGLGNSSVGLNAIINTNRNTAKEIENVRAQAPQALYDMKAKNLGNATQGIQSISTGNPYIMGREGGARSGGLATLFGGGLGAYFGGARGAQAGMGMGSAFSNIGV